MNTSFKCEVDFIYYTQSSTESQIVKIFSILLCHPLTSDSRWAPMITRLIWIANCRKGTGPKNSQYEFSPSWSSSVSFCKRRIPRWRKLILWIFRTCFLSAVSDSFVFGSLVPGSSLDRLFPNDHGSSVVNIRDLYSGSRFRISDNALDILVEVSVGVRVHQSHKAK
jgi:hypothetical protein